MKASHRTVSDFRANLEPSIGAKTDGAGYEVGFLKFSQIFDLYKLIQIIKKKP